MPRQPRNDAARNAYTDRLIDGSSPANRPLFANFIADKRAQGSTSGTLQTYAVTLSKLDRFLHGAPLRDLDPTRLRDFLLDASRFHVDSTVTGMAVRLRHFHRHLLDLDADDPLPRPVRKALKRGQGQSAVEPEPLTREEFTALLTAAADLPGIQALRVTALLWTLWDSGMRVSAVLALPAKGGLVLDGEGSGELRVRSQALGLKSKTPKPVIVVECIPAVLAWLAAHPNASDPDADMFPPPRNAQWQENIDALLDRLSKKAGIRSVNAHLFRHTRATRMADGGATESELREHFWWTEDSPMPSRYVHKAQRRLRERIRREHGLLPTGAPLPTPVTAEKTCPSCAEQIKAAATKCKHCGEFVGPQAKQE